MSDEESNVNPSHEVTVGNRPIVIPGRRGKKDKRIPKRNLSRVGRIGIMISKCDVKELTEVLRLVAARMTDFWQKMDPRNDSTWGPDIGAKEKRTLAAIKAWDTMRAKKGLPPLPKCHCGLRKDHKGVCI